MDRFRLFITLLGLGFPILICYAERRSHTIKPVLIEIETFMQVLQLTTTISESGYLCLDIPTQLAPGEVSIVLVLNPISSLQAQKPNYDFSDLAGRLTWQGDAVTTQRVLRDEW